MNLFQLATRGIDLNSLPDESAPERDLLAFEPTKPGSRLAVPQELDAAFQAAGDEYGVDADVLRAMAFAESNFNPKAVSPKGAVGLMQFMKGTADEYGIDRNDPIESIFGAAAYMRKSLEKFGGDYGKAVASYNAGPNLDAYKSPVWQTLMPKETRDYINTVFGAADELKLRAPAPASDAGTAVALPSGVAASTAGAGRGSVSPGMVNTKIPRAAVPDMTFGGVAQDVASGLLQVGPTAVKGVGEVIRLATGDRLGKGVTDFAERGIQATQDMVGSERAAAQRQNFAADMADDSVGLGTALANNKGALADQILPTIGSMFIPVGAAGAAGKLATVGKAARGLNTAALAARVASVQQAAGIGATAAQNAASTFAEMLDKGVPMQEAYTAAGITVPFSLIAGKLTGGGAEGALIKGMSGQNIARGVGEVGKGLLREGAQEGGESLGQVTGEVLGANQDVSLQSGAKRVGTEALLGAVMGGGMNAAQQIVPTVESQPTTPTAPVVPQVPPSPAPPTNQTAAEAADVASQILQAEQSINPTVLAAELDALRARSAPDFTQRSTTPQAQPGSVPVTGGLAAELQALRARSSPQEVANAPQRTPSDTQQQTQATSAQAADVAGVNAPVPAANLSGAGVAATQATGVDISTTQGVPANVPQPAQSGAQASQAQSTQGTTTGARVVLQNRDRSTPSSIAQMRSIAARPDYGRLGFSRDFANGAPVVAGGTIQPAQLGRQDVATASDGRRIPVQYAVVDAGSVLTSNAVDGTSNPSYGDSNIPAVRAIAGNGRIAGLQSAYQSGNANAYRQELVQDASLHGIAPEVIAPMAQPVLVRVMPAEAVTADIGDISNTVGNLDLSAVEQASNDANRVTLDALQFAEDGSITPEVVRQFVRAMPQAEQGQLLDTNGQPTRQAVDRLSAAVFAKAYGNEGLTRLYSQAQDPEARLVMSALAQVAPKMARLEGAGALDIRDVVAQAAEIAVNARRQGVPLARAAQQLDIAADPAVVVVLDLFAANSRSVRPVVEALARAADAAYTEATKPAEDMFGAVPRATRADIINQLRPENERRSQEALEDAAGRESAAVDAVGQANEPAGPAAPAEAQAGRPAEDAAPEGLNSYTPEEVTRRQAEAAQAEAKENRAEDAAARAEAAARQAKEIAQRSVVAADTFELGQSGEDNLSGQGGLKFSRGPGDGNAGDAVAAGDAQFRETERAYGGREAYDRAKAAGRTKLTYGQWVQVRTPKFKAWFGDWEAVRARDTLQNMGAVPARLDAAFGPDFSQAKALAKNEFDKLREKTERDGFAVVAADGRKIAFSGRGFKEVAQHSADRRALSAAANLQALFESAVPLYSSKPDDVRQQVAAFHYYGVKADFGQDGQAFVMLEVIERSNGDFFYDADATSVEEVRAASSAPLADQTKSGAGGFGAARHGRLAQWVAGVNPQTVSKVVDPDTGEPLVVYHGTRRSFDVFSPSKPRGALGNPEGVYFTADKGAAEEYAQDADGAWDEKSRVVSAYIKIENDADGKVIDSAYRGLEYVVFKPENIKSATGNNGQFDPTNPDIRYSFAGSRAATADKHALVTAQDRLDAGEDPETVRQETGWHRGADGRMRFEISDADALLKADTSGAEGRRTIGQMFPLGYYGDEVGLTVGRMLHHPALFAAYPAIADIKVKMVYDLRGDDVKGSFNPSTNTITLNQNASWRDAVSTLLHEIQHGIQNIEGFATGGPSGNWMWMGDMRPIAMREYQRLVQEINKPMSLQDYARQAWNSETVTDEIRRDYESNFVPSHAKALQQRGLDKDLQHTAGWNAYRRLAGEVEARNTQARQNMTDAERRATPPSATADVADADVIVTFNGKEMANAPMPANAAPDAATTAQPLRTPAATIRAAITKAYGKLLGQLESNGLVTLTQTEDEAIEAAARARAEKTGGNVYAIKRSMTAAMQGETGVDVKRSADGAIQGFFDPQTGQSFLIADNLTAEAAPGVLMHEVGIHMAADGSMKALFNRAAMMLKLQRGNPFMKAVQDRMDAAGETSGEEAAAYIAEAYENDRTSAPASVSKWVQDFIASVRAWLFNKGVLLKADQLTVADIAAVARANARSMARGAGWLNYAQKDGAFKFGNTDGQRWNPDSYADSIEALAQAELEKVNERIPVFKFLEIDPATGDVYSRGGTVLEPEGQRLGDGAPVDGRIGANESGGIGAGNLAELEMRLAAGKKNPRRFDGREQDVVGTPARDADAVGNGAAIQGNRLSDSELARYLASTRGGFEAHGVGVSTLKRALITRDHAGTDVPGLLYSKAGNNPPPIPTNAQAGLFAPSSPWELPEATRTDRLIYELQDGRIDLKRVQEAIAATGKQITEGFDARLAETLMPGRIARRTESFLSVEVKPLLESMARNNVSQDELSDYLLARHAPERNAQIAKVNPDMPDGGAGTNSQGVLMTTQAARDHIAALTAGKRTVMELLARQVDALTLGTREILVREGLEKQETVDAWAGAYQHYVPLFKDEAMETPGHPIGAGMSVTGTASKRATGSRGEVTNMVAHILMQREAAITRAEKNRVAMALYGLALTNPNAEMWTTIRPSMPSDQIANELVRMGVDPMEAEVGMQGVPTIRSVDSVSGKVVDRPNPMYKRLDNALVVKVNGEDRVILFNANNKRAARLVQNLKNQDRWFGQLDIAGSIVGKATRYFAAINTQYNPAFGMVNVIRDVGGALVNLTDTQLAGQQARVLSDSIPAMIGIARDLRGDAQRTPWSDLWQQFQDDGGRTGYRDLFIDPYKRADAVQKELETLGKDGKLTPGAAAHAVLDLLDDFNTTLENGVRLAAYKAALDKGLSRAESARLARELTLDFNRKGRAGRELGPLFAFFNASVQGTARTLKALQGPAGKRILAGGLALGVMQALMLAAAGFDDDEIPEFIKARAFIIPMPGKQYIAIPLQFGLNALPNTGRVVTELLMSGGKDWGEKSFNALGELAGSFNPLGGGNIFTGAGALKTILPTVIDPIVDMATNTDFTGKPIGKERMPWDTRPGFAMARESTKRSATGQVYIGISKAINTMTGGNDFAQGLASPSPEEVRYVFTTVGGGVFRELEKILNASVLTAQGESLKAREVPFGSRFAGEVDDQDLQRSRYFKNTARLEKLEAQLKGFSKEGRGEEVRALVKDNPEIRLYELSNQVQSEITKLNKLAGEHINDKGVLKRIDAARTTYMRALNDKVREMEREGGATK